MNGPHAWWNALKAALPKGRRQTLPAAAPQSRQGQRKPSSLPPDVWEAARQKLDQLMTDFTALQKQLKQAARQDGLDDDGPMVPTLQALYLCMATLREISATLSQIPRHYVGELLAAITASHAAATAETQRFRAELEHMEADVTHRIAGDIARSAEQAFTRRARIIDRNSGFVAAGALLLVGVGGYYWRGSVDTSGSQDMQQIQHTLQQIREAMQPIKTAPQPASTDGQADDAQSVNRRNKSIIGPEIAKCALQPDIANGHKPCEIAIWLRSDQKAEATEEPRTSKPVPYRPSPPEPPQTEEPEVTGPLAGFPPSRAKHIGHFGPWNGQ